MLLRLCSFSPHRLGWFQKKMQRVHRQEWGLSFDLRTHCKKVVGEPNPTLMYNNKDYNVKNPIRKQSFEFSAPTKMHPIQLIKVVCAMFSKKNNLTTPALFVALFSKARLNTWLVPPDQSRKNPNFEAEIHGETGENRLVGGLEHFLFSHMPYIYIYWE